MAILRCNSEETIVRIRRGQGLAYIQHILGMFASYELRNRFSAKREHLLVALISRLFLGARD